MQPFLMVLLISSQVGAANNGLCERLTKRFSENERLMGATWDLNVGLYRADSEFADKVGSFAARSAALKTKILIYEDELAGKKRSDEILTLMLAAKCTPPDHDASHLTFGNERAPD